MKKITSWLLTLVMFATMFTAVPVSAETVTGFAGGTGTDEDPYKIANAAQLRYMNELVNTGATYVVGEETKNYYAASYKLIADIDLENGEWIPIGQALPISYDPNATYSKRITRENGFEGAFDGANHVIKNVKMTHASTDESTIPHSQYLGFFGYCKNATIKNLGLDGIDIQWYNYDYKYATYTATDGEEKDAKERATYIGALAGGLQTSKVTNCYVINSNVVNTSSGTNDTSHGGFIGALATSNTVTNCYVYNVTLGGGLTSYQSGFVGDCISNGNIVTNCYAAVIKHSQRAVHPTTYGFMCNSTSTRAQTVTNCYSTMGDAQGAGKNKNARGRAYAAASSLGEPGVTAEALCAAMLATGVYEQKASVNGGYPYLKVGFDGIAATAYAGGSGTEDDPWKISTAAQLLRASEKVSAGEHASNYFILTNDIDYNYQEWHPFGTSRHGEKYTPLRGGFDGNNHVVKNLAVTSTSSEVPYDNVGFFGIAQDASIKNLGIDNIQISVSNSRKATDSNGEDDIQYLAGFVAYAQNTSVENCFVKNSTVWQTNAGNNQIGDIGGFVGMARGSGTSFKNCYAYNITVKNGWSRKTAGFVGALNEANGARFQNCFAAVVDVESRTGNYSTTYGFGYKNSASYSPSSVVNCYSTLQGATGYCNYGTVKDYDTTMAFGTEGATMQTIVSNFDDITAFGTTDTSINSGYPYLAFETPAEIPDYMIKSVTNEIALQTIENDVCTLTSDHKVTVNIARKSGVTGIAKVYVAGYDIDGRLTGAQMATVNLDDFSFTADVDTEKAKTIKVFLWDGEQKAILTPYKAKTTAYDQFEETWAPVGVKVEESEEKTRLVLMGDSIMDSKWNTTNYSWNKYGWEAYIGQYLTDDMTVVKHGHSGQTVKNFIEGRTTYHICSWDSIKTEFGQGDYVVLALGSNDHNAITAGEFTVEEYKEWYRQIIRETQAKGATIIISTPKVAASTYNATTGKFDPESQAPKARKAAIEVANEMGVDYVDMATVYADALNTMIKNKEYTYEQMIIQKDGDTVTGPGLIYVDGTHLTEFGAQLFAKLFAEKIETMTTGLEKFIVLPTE